MKRDQNVIKSDFFNFFHDNEFVQSAHGIWDIFQWTYSPVLYLGIFWESFDDASKLLSNTKHCSSLDDLHQLSNNTHWICSKSYNVILSDNVW